MLSSAFFQRDVLVVARDLIGVELVWHPCSGIIVETEAYAAEGDEASHTAQRPSTREFVKTHPPGAAYVYLNYGMYWLFNLLVKGGPRDGLILIRALEPVRGIEEMKRRRRRQRAEDLCSGPGKLALALGITGRDHGISMCGRARPSGVGLRRPKSGWTHEISEDVRVGISKAAHHPWRFLAQGHPHVSVPLGKVRKPT
ncbi:MAG TPA: DNA-3-methyladenine glycosylase [Verrucomicrobiaceae bacterium]|jgi:DNA-3-methyladenine glycosylase